MPIDPTEPPRRWLLRPISPRLALWLALGALLAVSGALWGGLWLRERAVDRFLEGAELLPDAARHAWGFTLTPLRVARRDLALHPGSLRKDDLPVLVEPRVQQAPGLEEGHPAEHVIGVVAGGEARAYPFGMLAVHGVINDTVGGVPIALVSHPLTATISVFSRRVGGETLVFGSSGLMAHGEMALYDRRPDLRDSTLWSPTALAAIAGPGAARRERLEPLDAQLMPYIRWLERHPEGSLLSRRNHFEISYGVMFYFMPHAEDPMRPGYRILVPPIGERDFSPFDYGIPGTIEPAALEEAGDRPPFKISGHPSGRRPDLHWTDPVIIVRGPRSVRGYPFTDLVRGGPVEGVVDGIPFRLEMNGPRAAPGVLLRQPGGAEGEPELRRGYAAWFLFDALYPRAPVPEQPPGD